jgi:hypothetical protein
MQLRGPACGPGPRKRAAAIQLLPLPLSSSTSLPPAPWQQAVVRPTVAASALMAIALITDRAIGRCSLFFTVLSFFTESFTKPAYYP